MRACRAALLVLTLGWPTDLSATGALQQPEARLLGTILDPPPPSADFTLTDQNGLPFHLADSRGEVVVPAFIYTHCSDVCPFVALKVREAIALRDGDAGKAVFVAVTTDPARDTRKVIADYSRAVGLLHAWHFLTGPLAELQSVWAAYGIGVEIEGKTETGGLPGYGAPPEEPLSMGLSEDDIDLSHRIIQQFDGGYDVSHSTPYWCIDPSGRARAIMDADVTSWPTSASCWTSGSRAPYPPTAQSAGLSERLSSKAQAADPFPQ